MNKTKHALALTCALIAAETFAATGKTMYQYFAYEAAFWPKNTPVKASEYEKLELEPIAKLPFDTLVFAPAFGFGSMAGFLSSATYPKHQPSSESRFMRAWKNAMPELAAAKIDPIAVTVQWCRRRGER